MANERDPVVVRRLRADLHAALEKTRTTSATLTDVAKQRDDAIAQRDRYRDALLATVHALGTTARGSVVRLNEVDDDVRETTRTRILEGHGREK